MADAAAAPCATPLERVSPSLAEDLRACGLRVAFRGDSRYARLRRLRPGAALGIVVHELAERVARGQFQHLPDDSLDEALKTAWDTAIARQADTLREEWNPAEPPAPERWPGYALTRIRCLRRLREQVRQRRDSTPNGGRAPQAERWVQAPEAPIGGRIDGIEHTSAGVEIVDIKSGWTVPDELRPSHRRQLLIYAYLWHAAHGEWPVAASIQRLDGSRIDIIVDPAEATAEAEAALDLMAKYNREAAEAENAYELARPSRETCLHCDFKVACHPFFDALDSSWRWYRRAILGDVKEVLGGEAAVVEVECRKSNLVDGADRVRIVALPASLVPSVGASLAVTDLLPGQAPSDVRFAWDTSLLSQPAK